MASIQTRQYNILRTIPAYFPYVTGPANQAREISRRLRPHGYNSKIVTSNLNAITAPNREELDGAEVVRLPVRAGFMQYHLTQGTWRELSSSPADIIHAHCYRNYLADVVAVLARTRRIPLILQLHGTLSGYRNIAATRRQWLYRTYDALFGLLPTLRAQRIIVSTREEAKEAEQYGLDRARIRIIPMGIDLDQYNFPDVSHDPRQLLFVGRISEDRNVELLLQALCQITDLPWLCQIVGGEERRSFANRPGYLDRLRQLAHELGIAARVNFTGPLHGVELRRTYAQSGIFVYPSRYENFGQTILEAAAAGCALVSTRVGVANDLIDEGNSGLFVEEQHVELLATAIRLLLGHPEQQRGLGEAVRARVHCLYAWEPIIQTYDNLYEEVISEYEEVRSYTSAS